MYLRPEGGSPTHTLPSLSEGDNETDRGSKREEGGFSPSMGRSTRKEHVTLKK